MTRRYKVLSVVLVLIVLALSSLPLVLSHDSPCGVALPVPTNTQTIKAIFSRCYDSPVVVKLEDIGKPTPPDDRVLIKVHAASVNPLDWHYMRGKPYVMRAMAETGAPDNGASGGVGTFAVQITQAFGAGVTGVCSTRNLAMVRSIGVDHAIDYTREDFTQGSLRYDLIVDNVGTHSLSEYRRVLNPQGALVMVEAPSDGRWLGPLAGSIKGMLVAPFISQKLIFILAGLKQDDLGVLRNLMQIGKLTPVIDRHYKLSKTAEAIRYLEDGHARGKVVIALE